MNREFYHKEVLNYDKIITIRCKRTLWCLRAEGSQGRTRLEGILPQGRGSEPTGEGNVAAQRMAEKLVGSLGPSWAGPGERGASRQDTGRQLCRAQPARGAQCPV